MEPEARATRRVSRLSWTMTIQTTEQDAADSVRLSKYSLPRRAMPCQSLPTNSSQEINYVLHFLYLYFRLLWTSGLTFTLTFYTFSYFIFHVLLYLKTFPITWNYELNRSCYNM